MSALVDENGADAASTLTLTRRVDAASGDVWRCLTDPECFKVWWHEHLDLEAREGGRFSAPWVDPTGAHRAVRAQVSAFHPPRGLVMVWADEDWSFETIVSARIEPDGEGSIVTIEHQGWHAAPDDERAHLMQHYQTGWSDHLSNWASHAEGLRRPRRDD